MPEQAEDSAHCPSHPASLQDRWNSMVDLALNDHFVVTQLTSDAVRLMQLDDMWTARAPIGKIDELNLIVEQMEPLIRQVSEQAARLRDIAVAHTMALDATLI